jgi:hypothetical protein
VERISPAQVVISLAAPLDSLFKRSNLRSLRDRDMIIILVACRIMMTVSTWKVWSSCHVFSAPASSIVECAPAPVAEWTEPIKRWQDLAGRAAVGSAVGAGGGRGGEVWWHATVLCGCEAGCEVLAEHGAGSCEHEDKPLPIQFVRFLSFLVICSFVCL